jgi:hypothetical protein
MAQISLDKLRETILANQAQGQSNPADPGRAIVVGKEGNIQLASNLSPAQEREFAKVQQDVFHARIDQEQNTVRQFLPRSTSYKLVDGVSGWRFSFACEFGTKYEMFAYFDGAFYQVLVMSPEIEDRFQSAHTGHIYKDGNICFGVAYNSGRPTLEEAYAKAVFWANGFSAMLLSGDSTFPFSLNNYSSL